MKSYQVTTGNLTETVTADSPLDAVRQALELAERCEPGEVRLAAFIEVTPEGGEPVYRLTENVLRQLDRLEADEAEGVSG